MKFPENQTPQRKPKYVKLRRAKFMCNTAFERGEGTQAHIVLEEFCEAVDCMSDEVKMREELVQLACTVVKWIDAIDSRAK